MKRKMVSKNVENFLVMSVLYIKSSTCKCFTLASSTNLILISCVQLKNIPFYSNKSYKDIL